METQLDGSGTRTDLSYYISATNRIMINIDYHFHGSQIHELRRNHHLRRVTQHPEEQRINAYSSESIRIPFGTSCLTRVCFVLKRRLKAPSTDLHAADPDLFRAAGAMVKDSSLCIYIAVLYQCNTMYTFELMHLNTL